MSDLRGSTRLADELPTEAFLEWLNSYCDWTAGAITAAGGQVVEIIGDAVLGIFPVIGDDDRAAARTALAAARDSRERMAAAERPLAFGIGLHLGNVIFGNVGTDDRLAFGLIGSAVNEAARIEDQTKRLGRPVLVSDAIATVLAGDADFEDMGEHRLEGLRAPQHLWALRVQ